MQARPQPSGNAVIGLLKFEESARKYKCPIQQCIAKMRADDGTSTSATWQLQFGAGPFTFELNR